MFGRKKKRPPLPKDFEEQIKERLRQLRANHPQATADELAKLERAVADQIRKELEKGN